MNRKIRLVLAHVVSVLPINALRVLVYRTLLGYRIHQAHIGWMTVIAVDHADLDGCRIGRHNRFFGPMRVTIKKGASIGNDNAFICGWWSAEKRMESAGYTRRLHIGENTLITSEHYFDTVGAIELGNGSWIGGCRSQFWSHGPGAVERDIRIGERCYIATAVRFAPGTSISDNTIVGMASVVTSRFDQSNVMLLGHPAKVVKEKYDWKTQSQLSA